MDASQQAHCARLRQAAGNRPHSPLSPERYRYSDRWRRDDFFPTAYARTADQQVGKSPTNPGGTAVAGLPINTEKYE